METEACSEEANTTVVSEQNILYLFPSDDKLFMVAIESLVHKLYECSNMLVGCTLKFSFTGIASQQTVTFSSGTSINPFKTQRGKIANPKHAMCGRFGAANTNYKMYCAVLDSKFNYVDGSDWQSQYILIGPNTENQFHLGMDWVLDSKFLVQYRTATTRHTL